MSACSLTPLLVIPSVFSVLWASAPKKKKNHIIRGLVDGAEQVHLFPPCEFVFTTGVFISSIFLFLSLSTFSALCRFILHCLTASSVDAATSDLSRDRRGHCTGCLCVCVCVLMEVEQSTSPHVWLFVCMCESQTKVCSLSHQSLCRCVSWTCSLLPLRPLEPPGRRK